MNGILRDLFAHNAWATSTLIDACRSLTDEQLRASTAGALGDIRATLEHMVFAEANYYRLLSGNDLTSTDSKSEGFTLDEINARATELKSRWEALQQTPFDVDRVVSASDEDGNRYEFAAGVILAQVFNHANVHREQVCNIMTVLAIDHPEIDGWNYSIASGRARRVTAQEAG